MRGRLEDAAHADRSFHFVLFVHFESVALEALLGGLDERRELAERTGHFEERMLQELAGRGALFHLDHEALVEKVEKERRQLVLALDGRLAVVGDQIERLDGTLVEVGRLALDHLDGHYAQAPYVHLGSVLLARHDLGRHPVGRTNHGISLGALGRDLRAEAEVGELDAAVHAQQYVVRLDVAVYDLLGVEELERLEHFAAHGCYVRLAHHCLGHHVCQIAASYDLKILNA